MDFSLTPEQKRFREVFRQFLERELVPYIDKIEEDEEFPMDFYKKLGANGFLGINLPREYGGIGVDTLTSAIFVEELSIISSGVSSTVWTSSMAAPFLIYLLGTDWQKSQYISGAVKGNIITANGVTEPNAGSDVSAIETKASKSEGHYIINGSKIFVTNGSVASIFIILCKIYGANDEPLGSNLFLVPNDAPGFSVSREIRKLGCHSKNVTEIALEDVSVSEENLLGIEGRGLSQALTLLNYGRTLNAATSLGIAEGAFEACMKFAKEEEQFGKPICKRQGIRSKLAKMYIEVEAARLLTYRSAWQVDQRIKNRREASAAKYYAADVARRVTQEALEIYGSFGIFSQNVMKRLFCDAPSFSIADGTLEMQLEIIAKDLGMINSAEMRDI